MSKFFVLLKKKRTRSFPKGGHSWSWFFLSEHWWVFLCLLACGFFYETVNQKTGKEFRQLQAQKRVLEKQYFSEMKRHRSLLKKKNSAGDPDFDGRMIKEVLGMIEEGETKVFFVTRAHH